MATSFNEITVNTGGGNYPPELLKNIRPDDEVVAFISIVNKEKGCLRKKAKETGNNTFLAITHERVVGTVESSEIVGGRFSKDKNSEVQTINVPIVKITSLTTTCSTNTIKSGCLSKSKEVSYYLYINAQGHSLKCYTGKDSTVNDQFIRSFLEISDYF